MTVTIPFVPGLPSRVPRHKGRRRCAPAVAHAWTLTPLLEPIPAPPLYDFLTLWYARVYQDGEHASLWGEVGLSPSRFVLAFAQVPLLVLHYAHLSWTQPEGLLGVVWLDDLVPGLRARLHQWVATPYRHPTVSFQFAQVVLRHLFTDAGFQMLEGRTPVGNRLGIRYALRLGFRPVATLPYGEWAWAADGTKTMTPVLQTQLTQDAWAAAHSSPIADERADEDARAWVSA